MKRKTAETEGTTILRLESDIKTLQEGIAAAKAGIAQNQLDLNRATEDRKAENFDFQKTIGDQAVTIEVLRRTAL